MPMNGPSTSQITLWYKKKNVYKCNTNVSLKSIEKKSNLKNDKKCNYDCLRRQERSCFPFGLTGLATGSIAYYNCIYTFINSVFPSRYPMKK